MNTELLGRFTSHRSKWAFLIRLWVFLQKESSSVVRVSKQQYIDFIHHSFTIIYMSTCKTRKNHLNASLASLWFMIKHLATQRQTVRTITKPLDKKSQRESLRESKSKRVCVCVYGCRCVCIQVTVRCIFWMHHLAHQTALRTVNSLRTRDSGAIHLQRVAGWHKGCAKCTHTCSHKHT